MEREKVVLAAMFLIVLASFAFWSNFVIVKYTMFRYSYSDFGFYAYNFYYTLHYPSTFQGLQYLVIGNHIAVDQLLVLPLFYLYQSPLTLLLLQVLVISLTGMIVFFIAKELLKNDFIALALGTAFVLNPGVQGMIVFDYHPEFLIIPFYLLTFYFYFKRERALFFASLLLLLGTLDSVVFIVLALGFGLIYYEFFHEKDSKTRAARLRLAAYIVVFSLISLLLYIEVANQLIASYSQGNAAFPHVFRAFQFDLPVVAKLATGIGVQYNYSAINSTWLTFYHTNIFQAPAFLFVAIVVAILVFGVAAINDPLLAIILDSPWLLALIGFGYVVYGSIDFQYFSYVIGGTVVSTLLGTLLIYRNRGVWHFISRAYAHAKEQRVLIICASILIPTLYAFMVGMFVHAQGTNAPFLLFNNSEYNASCYAQLNFVISRLPSNSSLMTESSIFPHVADRRNVEAMTWINGSVYFTPEYILVDFNNCINVTELDLRNESSILASYMSRFNYSVYLTNGTVRLYRLRG
ncbi:MAG: DUF2079 domain-containing protein [Candidatus Micrarchaeota archaeon]|nr:DUF2079 domain-containing protein [Candidatus Micrarchaeota archaeon]